MTKPVEHITIITLIDGFLHKIIQDPLAKAKTKINKLWALRFVFGWLIICEKWGNAMITRGKGTKLLEYYIAIISSHVSHLHQQAKIDSTLANQKEVLVARNGFLESQNSRSLVKT